MKLKFYIDAVGDTANEESNTTKGVRACFESQLVES